MRMNNEQRKFAEDNIKLVYKYAYKHNLDPNQDEDLICDLLEEYCKAICRFNRDKNNKFSTFLYVLLDRKMIDVYNYKHRKCRYYGAEPLSLNYFLSKDDNEEKDGDLSVGTIDKGLENIEQEEIYKNIAYGLKRQDDKSKRKKVEFTTVFNLLLKGYSKREICKICEISPQTLSKKIKKIKHIWEKELEGC